MAVLPRTGGDLMSLAGLLAAPAAGGGDPYFSSVVLLLHLDGADAGTTFTDSSASAKTVTAGGNAQLDTAQSKFGGASLLLDAAGDYLTTADSADWDCGGVDMTWEGWVRLTGTQYSAASILIDQVQQGTNSNSAYGISLDGADQTSRNAMTFYYFNSSTLYFVQGTGITINFDTWYHWAVCKYSGNNVRLFFNGVLEEDSVMSGGTPNNSTQPLTIGGRNGGSFPHYTGGWKDEIRITKGVARYTSTFTPPVAAFPDA